MNFRTLLNQAMSVIGTVVVICYANVIFIAVVIPIVFMYYFLQRYALINLHCISVKHDLQSLTGFTWPPPDR